MGHAVDREHSDEQRAEEARRAEQAEQAEDRREALLFQYMQRAVLEGREGIDPNDPRTFVPTVEQMADRVFREQDREAARNDFKAKLATGELHLLNVPPSEMTPPRAEQTAEGEALADGWLDRAHRGRSVRVSGRGFGGRCEGDRHDGGTAGGAGGGAGGVRRGGVRGRVGGDLAAGGGSDQRV
jgi:hypothetical protein